MCEKVKIELNFVRARGCEGETQSSITDLHDVTYVLALKLNGILFSEFLPISYLLLLRCSSIEQCC